ncbi:MAG: DUF4229 domain-containing protein [Flaviflexus sp.]|uniref:hypothetical protein n=1 Tax=Flaviflexus sp. TaxID=1969482 RepID=UPI00352CD4EC
MSILKYTLIRVLLVVAFGVVLYFLGMRSYLLAFTAIICGAMAGFLFFPRQGQEAAGTVEKLVTHKNSKPKDPKEVSDEDIEDSLVDDELEHSDVTDLNSDLDQGNSQTS